MKIWGQPENLLLLKTVDIMLAGENKNLKGIEMQQEKKYGVPENVCFSNFAECPRTINGINLRHGEDCRLLCWCKATSKPLKFVQRQSVRVDQSPPPLLSQASWARTPGGPGTSFTYRLKVILPRNPVHRQHNARTKKFILKPNLFLVALLFSSLMLTSGFQGLSLSFVLSTCLLSAFLSFSHNLLCNRWAFQQGATPCSLLKTQTNLLGTIVTSSAQGIWEAYCIINTKWWGWGVWSKLFVFKQWRTLSIRNKESFILITFLWSQRHYLCSYEHQVP